MKKDYTLLGINISIKRLAMIFVIGLLSGLVNGLLGIGGGTILIPAMVFLLYERQHQAHGTSLAIILPTAIVSTFIYGSHGNLDLMLALQVAIGG
ncbi:MAG: TSUP family transporter, partial [Bacillota bacterium]|nr:TSUP family transporter [Bacillota bacterium]